MFFRPTLFSLALAAVCGAAAAAEVPIDLTTWTQRGPLSNGNWVVAPDGKSVLQTFNGEPTFFVDGQSSINTTYRGKIRVGADGDDDYVGFVFGFNAPQSTGNNMDFVLFDWKQGNQSSGGYLAEEGFGLARVNGTITDNTPGFWGRTNSTGYESLAKNVGSTLGWVDNVEYDFTILYQESRIKIDIAGGAFGSGTTVFDIGGTFGAGSFGFYNFSQSQVRYSGLTQESTPPTGVPEPGSLALAGVALLAALGLRQRRA